MKVSPVLGAQAIPGAVIGTPNTDRIARAKAIAANQPPPEAEKETIQHGEPITSATQRIKMRTNHTVHRNGDLPIPEAGTEIHLKEPEAVVEEPKVEPVAETTQQAAVSDTTVEAKSALGDTKPISPELAELARERRALQVKERELAEKEKALKTQVPEGYVKVQDLRANALETLQKHGVTYQQLTDELLGQKPQPDINQLKEEILKSVEETLAGKDSAQEEAVYDYMQQNVERMARNNIAYRLIRETKSEPKVMELVKRMWRDHKEILDEEEAMGLIEAELREEAKLYAKLIGGQENDAQTAPKVQSAAPVKTLTNKDSARPAMTRRQRAIAAMLGQKL